MEKEGTIERLVSFGLTRQEAALYVSLYQYGGMTGYEAAKQTGISRSNAYSGLSALTEKGAAYKLEASASKFIPVNIQEFCENKIRRMEEDKKYLMNQMKLPECDEDGYLTITGARNIHNKIRNMLAGAQHRIYLSAPFDYVEQIEGELAALQKRGIKVVLITENNPGIAETLFYCAGCRENQLRLIVDSSYVLTGDVNGAAADTCLYTGQKNFVRVFKEALHNEIKLIELTRRENNEENTLCNQRTD